MTVFTWMRNYFSFLWNTIYQDQWKLKETYCLFHYNQTSQLLLMRLFFLHYTELEHKSLSEMPRPWSASSPAFPCPCSGSLQGVFFSQCVMLQLIWMAIIRAHQKMSTTHISNRNQFSALLALPSKQLFRHWYFSKYGLVISHHYWNILKRKSASTWKTAG